MAPGTRCLQGSLALLPFTCNTLYTMKAGGQSMRQKALKTSYGSTPKLPGSGFPSDVVWQPGGSNPAKGKGRAKQQQTNTLH